MPTTWLHENDTNKDQYEILDAISTSVIRLLTEAQKYGTVKIVTNARKDWVESSCRNFLPRCAFLLETIPIFSARGVYEWLYPDNPVMWKILAFQITTINHSHVISIGDTNAERIAALQLDASFRVKSIKLEEMPSIATFAHQVQMLPTLLGPIIAYDDNMDFFYDLETPGE
jgi:hypothetical protein